jgi:hypothetical protein
MTENAPRLHMTWERFLVIRDDDDAAMLYEKIRKYI